MNNFDDDLKIAFDVADEASRLAMQFFNQGVSTTSKEDGSPVTEADRAVERLVHQRLDETRPNDGFLGEEFGRRPGGERLWIVDPIDGTNHFAQQLPDWRFQLALEIQGRISVAVVVAPSLGLQWWATRSGGAYQSAWAPPEDAQPQRMSVSKIDSRDKAHIEAYPPDSIASQLPNWHVIPPGSVDPLQAVVPIQLLRGNTDGFIFHGCAAWDHAPWILLIEEAGGQFTDWQGGTSAHKAGGLFSNTQLHRRLAAELALG